MGCNGVGKVMLTPQQKDTLRNIGTGTVGSYPVQRGPERLACNDMAFGRKRDCPCYACRQARRVAAEGKERFGEKLPYIFFAGANKKKR